MFFGADDGGLVLLGVPVLLHRLSRRAIERDVGERAERHLEAVDQLVDLGDGLAVAGFDIAIEPDV